ncbi:MAG: sodium:calcium antiporter [Chloroflexi bacterium]|nr:sodium:calcium antiporter [Chloroflexota bacterium]
MIWLQFLISAAVIVAASMFLARYADAIALRTGLGRMFIGALLLSSVTSLPELLTTIQAFSQGVPNLAAGNLVGSNMFNMALLALADLAGRDRRVLRSGAHRHALTGSLTLMMIALAIFFLVADIDVQVGWVGLDSIVLILAYIGGVRLLQAQSRAVAREQQDEVIPEGVPPLGRAIIGFILAAAVLTVISPVLVSSSSAIAEVTGLGTSFVGLTLVALVTSLPEVVTTTQLVRDGAEDMAVGNLFGSNMFNMFAIGLVDFFYLPGRFLGVIESSFVLVGMIGLIMTALGLIGNLARIERRLWFIEIDALLMLVLYFGGLWLLYVRGITF